jgi:cytochrome c biogenesis protein CcmG/thiol:disulfide interchange protein DsbE
MGKVILAVLAVLAIVGFLTIGPAAGRGATPPDFQLYTPRGKLITLSEYRGRVVVLDFWASWCGPCRMAIPAVQRLHETYQDRAVAVFGINVRDNQDPAEFMEKMNAYYPVLTNGDDVAAAYDVKGIPTLIVISTDGRILYRETGWGSGFERDMREVIDRELARVGK